MWPAGLESCFVLFCLSPAHSTLWQGKRGCLKAETISGLSSNFRPFLAEWKTFFDSHYNQKTWKELSTSHSVLWVIRREFLWMKAVNQKLMWKHIANEHAEYFSGTSMADLVSFCLALGLPGFQIFPSVEAIARSHPGQYNLFPAYLAVFSPPSLYKSGYQTCL